MNKTHWLKSRPATVAFAIVAFIGGLAFLNQSFTGNIILNNKQPISLISFIGLALILCSVVLAYYSIIKR